jgi:abortive infection protein abiGII
MKTSEQIKGAIRNISKKTGVNPNSLLQMCLFEGILEKLSKSKYSENFILKGGLFISSLIGLVDEILCFLMITKLILRNC